MSKVVNLTVNQNGKAVAQGSYNIGKEGLRTPEEKQTLLRRMFGFGKKKKADGTLDYIGLQKTVVKNDKGQREFKFHPEQWGSRVDALFQKWKTQTNISRGRYESLTQVYADMDEMFLNNAYMAKTLKYRVAETLQQDLNMQPIGVEANKKQKKHILNFFDRVNIAKLLPETVTGRDKYGNHGWLLIPSETGIESIVSIPAKDIQDVLEFTPYDVDNDDLLAIKNKFNSERMGAFFDSLLEGEDHSAMFKKHIIGYQVGGFFIPPWQFIHFRNLDVGSAFYPFGTPPYMHSLSPYRKYDFMETMEAIAFGLRFPIEKFEFNIPNEVEPTESMYKVSEIMNQLMNSGLVIDTNFENSIGKKIVTIKDLYEYSIQELKVDFGESQTLEKILDEIMASTFLPKGMIDPRDSQYAQQSGKALIQDFKPFARDIFLDQQEILECISQAVKIDMIQSGDFSLEEINFTLTMPYPESQVNDAIIDSQKNQIDLVNKIVDDLGSYMGVSDKKDIPIDLIKDVFSQILPYDDRRINGWLSIIADKRLETMDEEPQESVGEVDTQEDTETSSEPSGGGLDTTGGFPSDEELGLGEEPIEEEPTEEAPAEEPTALTASTKKKHSRKELKEKLIESLSGEIQPLREGISNMKHFYSSQNRGLHSFSLQKLIEIDNRIIDKQRLTEES